VRVIKVLMQPVNRNECVSHSSESLIRDTITHSKAVRFSSQWVLYVCGYRIR